MTDPGSYRDTPLPLRGAEARAEAGSVSVEVSSNVSVTAEVHRAPFSEQGLAERLVADPIFYRNLAAFVASELRRQANSVEGQGNSGHVIQGQLTELAEGFESTAAALTTEGALTASAAQKAAEIISKVRDAYAELRESYPGLVDLAVIGLAGYALHLFGGTTADIGLLVSYAVIKKEKLSDIFSAGKKDKE